MANIQNELNNIKNAIYGKDVRNSIHNAIKQCYDDASVNNDNANMEVKLARGVHNTLNDRLSESDKKQKELSSQLEHIEIEMATKEELDVERSRIDLLSRVESGQTEGNAELLDTRIDIEGFEHDSTGNSVRHQINKIVDNFEKLPNLINHANSKDGFMETTGIVTQLQDFKYTELIKVQEGRTIYFGSTNKNFGYVKKAIAYTDKNTISQEKSGTDLLTWTVPSGVKYARFTYNYISYENLSAKYDKLGDSTDYEYGYNFKYSKLDKETKTKIMDSKNITDKLDIKSNLFDEDTVITLDKALTDKGVLYDATNSFVSDYIDLESNTEYSIECIRNIVFFDKNNNPISSKIISDDSKLTFVTPSNCVKCRFNAKKAYKDDNKVVLIKGKDIPYNKKTIAKILGDRVVFSDELEEKVASEWKGVEWCSYGDSITEFNREWNWQNLVTNYFEMGTHYNRGVGGSEVSYWEGMTFQWEGQTLPRGMCMWERIKTIPQTVKLIFFMGGTNDTGRYEGTPVGDFDFNASNKTDKAWYDYCIANELRVGDFDITTYKGAVASTIMKLQEWCPNALIIVGTQLSGAVLSTDMNATSYWKNKFGLTPIDYANYTKEGAYFMSKPIVDVFGETGVNLFNRSKYLSDTVHPFTQEGQKMIARVVISGLKNQHTLL